MSFHTHYIGARLGKNKGMFTKPTSCPNIGCKSAIASGIKFYIKKGYYKTQHNGERVPRYQCKECETTFSSRANLPSFRDKKPALNQQIFKLYASGLTQRRMAILLNTTRATVARKVLKIALSAELHHLKQLSRGKLKTDYIQFDEMMSFEHSNYKQIGIAVSVRVKTGEILDIQIEPIRCRGKLALTLPKKFKHWGTQKKVIVDSVISNLAHFCVRNPSKCTIETDSSRHYVNVIKKHLPLAKHVPLLARGAKKSKLGKKTKRKQPKSLFVLNSVCAKIRNDLSRMARRTWVTAKDWNRLQLHLNIYIAWNNGYRLRV